MKQTGQIQYGDKPIAYSLELSTRRTLSITVQPDLSVQVKAPAEAKREEIERRLLKRAGWIVRQQAFFSSFRPLTPPRTYQNGETHLYLGRQYRLRLIAADKDSVRLQRGFLIVSSPDPANKSKIAGLVQKWYRERAKEKLPLYLRQVLGRFLAFSLPAPKLELRKMDKRWGSCTRAGKILLNPDLIRAPKGCIEYVLVHELCHLLEPNHGPDFYDLQSRVMPDWLKWKERLERGMK
jgi:predicted metal-dependent hydrolase